MPTTLPRINVPFHNDTHALLNAMAARNKVSAAEVVRDLVNSALELSEDIALAEMADAARANARTDKRPFVTLDELDHELAGLKKKRRSLPKKHHKCKS